MHARIQKWGNSFALRIPRSFAAEAGITEGSEVDISVEEGEIRVRPISAPKFQLEDLLAQITADNLHTEVDSGPSAGHEAW